MPLRYTTANVTYQIARTRDELEQSYSLVFKEYKQRNLIPGGYKSKLRISIFNALPSTVTFVAKDGKKVLATVTLIPDSPLGIPMDKIYKKELDVLRRRELKIAEVSQLSLDNRLFPASWFSMFNFEKLIFVFKLFKLVLDYAMYKDKLDELCIAVNPKHQYLYKFLGFKALGGLKYYGSVNKAPAIAKHLHLESAEEKTKQRKGLYKIFFDAKIDKRVFENKFTFLSSDLEYFFVKKSDIFQKATEKQLSYIEGCYPKVNFRNILL